jgi:predicted protein tyrosine phosphatase
MSTSRTAPRITICGIPELGEHSAAGVTHVLSILGPNSPDPPEFAAFAPHRRLILRFHDVIEPQPDQIAPTREDVERLLVFGREVSETTEAHLLVHCRAGVSRSTAAAALILMQANPEWPASAALDAVAAIRPRAWPNLLILEFGDALLGRNGEIAAAAGAIYRRVLARDPEFGRPDDRRRPRPRGKRRLPRDRLTLCRVSLSGRTDPLPSVAANSRNRRASVVVCRNQDF